MEIIKLKIADLTPYENNAKEHPKKQIEEIKNSIKQFGFCDPVGIWGEKNIIVEGHGRVIALQEMGETEVECLRLDHLTDDERKAYTLAHNKTTLSSDFDFNKLEKELAELSEIDMSKFGFDIEKISPDAFGEDFSLPDGDKGEICQMTFTLHNEQAELIKYAMEQVKDDITETFGNSNSNGNALYEVVRQWAEQRK